MRKRIVLLFSLGLLLSCTSKENKSATNFLVLTSFFPMYIFTINIAGDILGIEIDNLITQSAGDLHGYQLSPKDMKKLEKAQMLIINSYEHERFAQQIAQAYPHLVIVEASQGITPIKDVHLEEDTQKQKNHDHGTINTHFWVSPLLAAQEVDNIAKALSQAKPQYAHQFQENAAQYITKLKNLNQKMQNMLSIFHGRSVITYHNAFTYLLYDLGLNLVGTLQLEPGVNPTPKQLFSLQKLLQAEKNIPIFSEPQYPTTLAINLAKETGAKVYSLNPMTNGKMDKEAYEKIMEENAKVLRTALE